MGLKLQSTRTKEFVDFLDVTFDLTSGSYKPCMKPNNKLLYVYQQSNHPPAVLLKNMIPLNSYKRLINISSSEQVFEAAITPYQKALGESGCDHKLTYHPEAQQTRNKRKRKRNITIGTTRQGIQTLKPTSEESFCVIIDKCFPKIHPLHKIFNRHTLKLSYSCMPNMKSTYHITQQKHPFKCHTSANSTIT